MAAWRFFDLVIDDRNLIAEWYATQDARAQAAFDAALTTLAAVEDWLNPPLEEFKVLEKAHAGLCTVRFDVKTFNPETKKLVPRHFRPATIWHKEKRELILILGCEKSGRIYFPNNALDTALKYKSRYESGEGYLVEHEV